MDPLALLPQHIRSLVNSNYSVPLPLPQAIKEDYALVAIIDISGYSKLSSKLEEALGSDSGGRIKEVINPPMEVITQYVHKYAGSIVKLAGDAVIASWTLDPSCNLPIDMYQKVVSLNVLLCCLELLEVFHNYEVRVNISKDNNHSGGAGLGPQYFEQSLKIHIGLGQGSIDHIHIGGKPNHLSKKTPAARRRPSSTFPQNTTSFSRREYFIAGDALAQAGLNLNMGEQGDFVFSDVFHNTLQETLGIGCSQKPLDPFSAVAHPTSVSYYISDTDPAIEKLQLKAFKFITPIRNAEIISKEQNLSSMHIRNPMYLPHAKSYMDASVVRAISGDQGVVKDQLRSVSVVFIKFGGFLSETVAAPENLKQLNSCAQVIIAKVQEYEGCVRQFNCDDKSLTALLVWGFEGHAHEKGEAQLAMLAATDIATLMKQCLVDPEGFSIGVTAGVVFAGIVGSKERCDNTVLGVVVNNAARLMCLPMCHGTVLCDEATYLQTASLFKYVTDLPEVILKVKIFNPMGDGSASKISADATIMSGREKEMMQLENSLQIWRAPPLDKSPKNVVLVGCSGIGKTQISTWMQEQIEDTEIMCREKMPKLLKIINILNMPLSCIETLAPITGFMSGQPFANGIGPLALVLADIFNAFCDIGLRICVFLDDIQWCDSCSLELTKSLLSKCPSILFVLTARPIDEWRLTSALTFKQILEEDVIKIDVQALTAAGVEHMLKVRLSADFEFASISPELVKELLDRGQGNPMVTSVLISTLMDEKLVYVKNNCITRSGAKELTLGMGSTAAVIAQFDKLSTPMKFLLRVVAISGQYFKITEICAALNLLQSQGQVSSIVPTVTGIQKLISENDRYKFLKLTEDDNEICFSHYLVQQAIISSMVPADRESIRRVFIEYYESLLATENERNRSSVRQSLIFHLIKVPGDDEKKTSHVYEAFLECGEMNQGMEALEYYNMIPTFEHRHEPADTCLKKVREFRILSRLYIEKGEHEKAMSLAKQALTVLGCKNSLVNPTILNMLPNILAMVMKVERILRTQSDEKLKDNALSLLREVFPHADIVEPATPSTPPSLSVTLPAGSSLVNTIKPRYSNPVNEEEQDKLFKEITTLIWVMAASYEQTKPGPELLLLSLMMTAPSLLSIESRGYRVCFFFCALATTSRIFGFAKLHRKCHELAAGLFKSISTEDMEERMTLYDLFMYANIHALIAKQRVLETEADSASSCGNHEEILHQWYEYEDSKYYDKTIHPFLLSEAKSFLAASLASLNTMDRANLLQAESIKHLRDSSKEFTDAIRILHVHMNLLRVQICNTILGKYTRNSTSNAVASTSADTSPIAMIEHLRAIESCMKRTPLRVFCFASWLYFFNMMTELALHTLWQSNSNASSSSPPRGLEDATTQLVRECTVRILKFVKHQFVLPKLACWPFLQNLAQAVLHLWRTSGKWDYYIAGAEKAIRQGSSGGGDRDGVADVQVLMVKARIWQAKAFLLKGGPNRVNEVARWKKEGEAMKLEFHRRADWELYLIDSLLASTV
ncbi:hypothetical protein HDU98_000432 [Podochytrium sp. JEL0797]|nr:hypothetical protein HDU98_000432 [Podochytrium sp. JEL0797]